MFFKQQNNTTRNYQDPAQSPSFKPYNFLSDQKFAAEIGDFNPNEEKKLIRVSEVPFEQLDQSIW